MKTIRRRNREGKTDYKARLSLLKSKKPRLVVRKTNHYIIAQIIETNIAQDKVIAGITSSVLLKKGWPQDKIGSLKSISAAYLTGFLLGKTAKDKTKEAILDLGLHRNIHKSRIYAVLKGVLDSGLSIPHNPEALPSEENLKKASLIDKIKEKI